jgi:hypothetical protein
MKIVHSGRVHLRFCRRTRPDFAKSSALGTSAPTDFVGDVVPTSLRVVHSGRVHLPNVSERGYRGGVLSCLFVAKKNFPTPQGYAGS